MAAVCCCVCIYVALSLVIDVFETASVAVHLGGCKSANAPAQLIALTFATFNGHLVDVAIAVIYINDWLSARVVLTVIGIVCFSMSVERFRKRWPARARNVEYRIL